MNCNNGLLLLHPFFLWHEKQIARKLPLFRFYFFDGIIVTGLIITEEELRWQVYEIYLELLINVIIRTVTTNKSFSKFLTVLKLIFKE